MFSFLRNREKKRKESECVSQIRRKFGEEEFLKKFGVINKGSWYEFEESGNRFEDLTLYLFWLCVLDIHDEIIDSKATNFISKNVHEDILLVETAWFTFFALEKLCEQDYFWNYHKPDGFYYIEDGLLKSVGEEIIEILSYRSQEFGFKDFDVEEELEDLYFVRRDSVYALKNREVSDWKKALCYQFTNVLRSHAESSVSKLSTLQVDDHHIALDGDLPLRSALQVIVESSLESCLEVMEKVMLSVDDDEEID